MQKSNRGTLIVGVSGHMQSGKDTFFNLLSKKSPIFKRYAFADKLKSDLHPFLIKHCGIDIFNPTKTQKEIVRPLLIEYGRIMRNNGDGLHWVREVENQILFDLKNSTSKTIPVITDVRFPNEAAYLKEKYNLILVEIGRENCPTPPDEELKNQPLVREYVDHSITWPTVGEDRLHELNVFVEDFCKAHNLP